VDQIEFLNEFIAAIDPSNPEAININTNLGEIPEWDSLAVLGVIVLFETMFNKKLTGEIIGEQKTVKEIYNLI
jgi:acyl carrier protein